MCVSAGIEVVEIMSVMEWKCYEELVVFYCDGSEVVEMVYIGSHCFDVMYIVVQLIFCSMIVFFKGSSCYKIAYVILDIFS